MIKLLDRPLKTFSTYALIVLLCSIPVYFIFIDFIWVNEINKRNLTVAASVKKNLATMNLQDSQIQSALSLWNRIQPEAMIQIVSKIKPDSTYNVYRKSPVMANGNYDRFQGLVTFFNIDGQPYSLTIESNLEESYETIGAITAITVVFFIILLFGFIILNRKISQNLWKPFYQTLTQIKSFDLSSDQRVYFESSTISEFEELNAGIEKLINSNVVAFLQQKEFTENASHELQTPLAIVQSKLDLLLQDPSITSGQSMIIEEINHALSRVSRINKNLLLLAKIENQQFLDKQAVNMSQLTQQILDLLSDLLGAQTIAYNINSECIVEGNVILLEVMLTNLFMNAVRYTTDDSKILISLSNNEMTVSNKGTYPLDSEKIFKRFSAASLQTPGSGLGLSIVKEICNRYGWGIRYQYAEFMHVFKITFIDSYKNAKA
jgi:signal transduction histidine kinase